MRIKIISFGKMDKNGTKDLQNFYLQKLKRFCNVEVIEEKESTIGEIKKDMNINENKIEKYLLFDKSDYFLLDIDGRQYESPKFANDIFSSINDKNKNLIFLIGPSDGFSIEFRQRFSNKISFGKLTMEHKLARIILLEQIYRSFKIIKNEKYHK